MAKRLFNVGGFEARFVGPDHVHLYVYQGDRFRDISIHLPVYETQMRTGKKGLTPGYLTVGSSSSDHKTLARSRRLARAILAATDYLEMARLHARARGR